MTMNMRHNDKEPRGAPEPCAKTLMLKTVAEHLVSTIARGKAKEDQSSHLCRLQRQRTPKPKTKRM